MDDIENVLYKETMKAYKRDEVPIGCVITRNNKIIAKGFNTRQNRHICINHAEIRAIMKAEKKLKDWRLDGCDLYVTLKPCNMCAEVIKEARISNVYYILDSKYDNSSKETNYIKYPAKNIERFNDILSLFFKNKR